MRNPLKRTIARTLVLALASSTVAVLAAASPARADAPPMVCDAASTYTWIGASSDVWSDGASWDKGTPPVDGACVIAGPGTNDIAGLELAGLTITGSASGVTITTITGAAITLVPPGDAPVLVQDPGALEPLAIEAPLVLAGPNPARVAVFNKGLELRGAISSTTGQQLLVETDLSGTLRLTGPVAGLDGISLAGSGRLSVATELPAMPLGLSAGDEASVEPETSNALQNVVVTMTDDSALFYLGDLKVAGLVTSGRATIDPRLGTLTVTDEWAFTPVLFKAFVDATEPAGADHSRVLLAAGSHPVVPAGEINLSGTLNLKTINAPAVGTAYTIVQNDSGSTALTGAFTGLPDGTTFVTGDGHRWTIAYPANQVVVTYAGPADPAEQLAVPAQVLPAGMVGMPYSASVAVTGGQPPYSFTAESELPPGLAVAGDGRIVGRPTAPGTTTFFVGVTDSVGTSRYGELSITIDEAPGTSVWSGGGADDLWPNPANWVDGRVPEYGSDVILPAGPTDRATVVDFDVALRSLTVEDDGYAIGGAGLVDVADGSFSVAAGATLTLAADVDLPENFLGAQGTVVLAGDHERVDGWHPLGNAPTVVVTGTYPNLAITRCDVRCDVGPGAVLGALEDVQAARVSGTVLGSLDGKGSQGRLDIGPAGATSGSTAYAGGLGFGPLATINVRVFADGTADRIVVAGEVTIGQSGVIGATGPESFTGPAPQSIVVIDNDGTDPVGRTRDTPTTVELGGVLYRITLDGGDGNDVALVQADTTGPEITPTIDPPTPLGGWHAGTVNVSWTVTDPDGPVTSTGCDPTTIATDTAVAGTTLTCSATSAGGESSASVTIKRDGTAPTISGSVAPLAPNGSNDWYVTAPTVSFTCGDALSGIQSCPTSSTLASSDTGQFVSGMAFDVAGKSAVAFVGPVLVDLVDPVVTCPESVTFTVGEEGVVTAAVSDVHSGPAQTSVEGDADTSSVGTKSVVLTGADVAGNTTTVSCAYSVSDDSAPVVTATVDPATPASGWHTTDVTVTWSVVDEESELETEGCEPTTVSTDTTELTLTCWATSAGGTGTGTVTIKRDATAPTITGSVSPPSPNGENGWYKGPTGPTVSFTCEDATSGVATCSAPTTLSSSTTPQSVTGEAADVAGNTGSATVSGLKVDVVDPTLVCTATPTFSVGQAGSVSATVSDEHSGPAASSVIGGVDTSTAGTFTKTLATKDVAGNIGSVTCTYVVDKVATTLFAHPVLVKLTGGISFSYPLGARLTGPGGAPIATQLVQFSIGGRRVCSARTDTSGWASCGSIANMLAAIVNGGFTATYAETATYRGSTDSAGLFG